MKLGGFINNLCVLCFVFCVGASSLFFISSAQGDFQLFSVILRAVGQWPKIGGNSVLFLTIHDGSERGCQRVATGHIILWDNFVIPPYLRSFLGDNHQEQFIPFAATTFFRTRPQLAGLCVMHFHANCDTRWSEKVVHLKYASPHIFCRQFVPGWDSYWLRAGFSHKS